VALDADVEAETSALMWLWQASGNATEAHASSIAAEAQALSITA
jgi:hypothetical protein